MIINSAPSTVLSDPEHRYALAARKLSPQESVLDVGGYNDRRELIAKVIGNNFRYTPINSSSAWYGDSVTSESFDGNCLPYKDMEFDTAISVDTLEHVDPKDRASFIAEMIRVSNNIVLVTPFRDTSRPTLEPTFARISKLLKVEVKPSVKEHVEKGLPTLDKIRSYMGNQPFNIKFGTDYTKFWQMIFLQLVLNAIGRGKSKKINKLVQSIFEERLKTEESLDRSTAYRVIVST
jgi:hypothetical protein